MTSEHITANFLNLKFHLDTIIETWAIMLFILIITFIGTRTLKTKNIGIFQFFLESIYDLWAEQITAQLGKKNVRKYLPFIGAIFCFFLFVYWSSLIPWKIFTVLNFWPHLNNHKLWEYTPLILDINLPFGIALCSLFVYLITGTVKGGWSYWSIYFAVPQHHGKISFNFSTVISAFIEWLDLFTRPLTLTLRIFSNVLAGEALSLTTLNILPLFLPISTLFFEFAIGILQAFIFATLSLVYISIALLHVQTHSKGNDKEYFLDEGFSR